MSTETFTVKHKYAPSVLAVYSSSCNLIWVVRTLYAWESELSARFSVLWSNCFSAAVSSSRIYLRLLLHVLTPTVRFVSACLPRSFAANSAICPARVR